MEKSVKTERGILFSLAVLLCFAIPVSQCTAVRAPNTPEWLLDLPNDANWAGMALFLFAAWRYSYRQCVVFLLPNLVGCIVLYIFCYWSFVNDPQTDRLFFIVCYVWAMASPFLYLALERVLASHIAEEGRYAVLAALAVFLCQHAVDCLIAGAGSGYGQTSAGQLASLGDYVLSHLPHWTELLGVESGTYALLWLLLGRRRAAPAEPV